MNPAIRVAQLIHVLERVDGRKKLQKLVHVLQKLGYSFPEKFRYSFYGMYSQQLRDELDTLEDDNLIDEKGQPNAGGAGYTFETTPKLGAFLDELGLRAEPEWAALAKELNVLSAHKLEGISTIFFLRELGLEGDQLKKRLVELKPHLQEIYSQCDQEAKRLTERKVA
jgi:uncharacterized protein YwgA